MIYANWSQGRSANLLCKLIKNLLHKAYEKRLRLWSQCWKKIATLVAVLNEVAVLNDSMFRLLFLWEQGMRLVSQSSYKIESYIVLILRWWSQCSKVLLYYDCEYDRRLCKMVRILLQACEKRQRLSSECWTISCFVCSRIKNFITVDIFSWKFCR